MKPYPGYHTCLQKGGKHYVLKEAPFLADIIKEKDRDGNTEYRYPFLGIGYYFWEYDLDQAIYWGKSHCRLPYFVLKGLINTTNENFLDLIGDLQAMGWLLNRANQLVKAELIEPDFTMSELIEYLKGMERLEPGNFGYQIIRARDFIPNRNDFKVYFNEKHNYTYLSGRHIFCLTAKNEVILSSKEIVYTS